MFRTLFYRIRCIEIIPFLFKLIWIVACFVSYKEIKNDDIYIFFFLVSAFLLYENEGGAADIEYFRSGYRKLKGCFILIPFISILGYIYNLFNLSFITTTPIEKDIFLNDFAKNGCFILGCVVLMIVLFCRLREFYCFKTVRIPIFLCIILAGTFLGFLLGNASYIPLGIFVAYLYEKFNYPIIMGLFTTCCLIDPFWDGALFIAILSILLIFLLRRRLYKYGNPVFLFLGTKIDGPTI